MGTTTETHEGGRRPVAPHLWIFASASRPTSACPTFLPSWSLGPDRQWPCREVPVKRPTSWVDLRRAPPSFFLTEAEPVFKPVGKETLRYGLAHIGICVQIELLVEGDLVERPCFSGKCYRPV